MDRKLRSTHVAGAALITLVFTPSLGVKLYAEPPPYLVDGTCEEIPRHQRRGAVVTQLRSLQARGSNSGTPDWAGPIRRLPRPLQPIPPQLTLNSPVAPFEASLNLWVTNGYVPGSAKVSSTSAPSPGGTAIVWCMPWAFCG